MIPPLHTHSLVPDITLGIARLLGYSTFIVVLAWRGVAKGYYLQCEEGSKHLQLDYIVHIHSVMITYSVSLDSICIAVGGRAIGS